MSIEEKAKAYDEALKWMRELYPGLHGATKEDAEHYFPELRESEDERIRKWIIEELEITRDAMCGKHPYSDDPDIVARLKRLDEAIYYLEKQQEIPMPNSTELIEMWDKEEAMLKEKDFRGDTWRIAYNAFMDGFAKGTCVKFEKQKSISQEDFDTAKHEALGEQNRDFTIYHPLKNGNGKYECIPYSFYGSLSAFSKDKDLIDFLRTCFYTKEECEKWIKQQEQKSRKFKLGDKVHWHDDDTNIITITGFRDDAYLTDSAHGPILFCDEDNWERIEQKPDIELIQRSWYMEGYHDREFGMEPRWIVKTGEGGPKHEKNPRYGQHLEPKPAEWSEEDERMLSRCIKSVECSKQFADSETYKAAKDTEMNWLQNLSERFNIQPKQEWSEEDERMVWFFADDYDNNLGNMPMREVIENRIKFKDWLLNRLKSIRPQPKVELSEDVKKTLDEVSHILVGLNYKQIAKDYKQAVEKLLYSRPSWKPSEEQMEALKGEIKYCYACGMHDRGRELQSLCEYLEKLM